MRTLVWTLMLALACAEIPPPCDETETFIVEVKGEFSDFDSVKIYNNTSHENFSNDDANLFKSFKESENGVWQGCLPKDACFMAEIRGAPEVDELTFKQDGTLVETRFTFPDLNDRTFKTFVELGDCIPTCEDAESLLEFDIYIGYSGTSPVWWIQDEDSNRVAECDEIDGRCVLQARDGGTRFHRIRQCLPSSQCHLFVAGDEQYTIYSNGPAFHVSFFNLTYNGELLATREGFRFESIEFGNGCSPVPCHDDNEALFELFLFRDNVRDYTLPNLSLQVTDGFDIMLQDLPESSETLHYYRGCLSRDSCLNLTLSVPETDSVTHKDDSNYTVGYFEEGEVGVVFDNVIYRDSGYHFRFRGNNNLRNTFNDTTPFGNCNVPGFCGTEEMIVDVTFHAPDGVNKYDHFGASVQYVDEQVDKPAPLYYSNIFDGYMSGNTYRTTQCISCNECMEFVAGYENEWSKSFEYTVVVNGEAREERLLVDPRNYQESIHTTLGGATCTQELSSGLRFAVLIPVAIAVGYMCYRIFKPANCAPLEGPDDEETCCTSYETDDESVRQIETGAPIVEGYTDSSQIEKTSTTDDEDECIDAQTGVMMEDTL